MSSDSNGHSTLRIAGASSAENEDSHMPTYSVKEAALKLGVKPESVTNLVYKGRLAPCEGTTTVSWRFTQAELDRWSKEKAENMASRTKKGRICIPPRTSHLYIP